MTEHLPALTPEPLSDRVRRGDLMAAQCPSRDVLPPHVEYSLSPLGREVAEKVRGLADWIEVSMPRIAEAQQARARS